jgi:deazaflavin-dependent oxidoreductase (nitroreductase family)
MSGGICDDIHENSCMKVPRWLWRLIHFGPRIAYALGLGSIVGRFLLLLTTFGRKTGRARVTPLVYEQQGNTILVASARGPSADWLKNIRANPKVQLRVGSRQFDAIAEVTSNPEKITDYLQRQLKQNPKMFGAILRSEGLASRPDRAELVRFAPKRPMVTIRMPKDVA